jgi:glycerol transport system ATP-binding protein
MATIELVGVSHAYTPGKYAVRDINLKWEHGVSSALLGPSGCGKTTVLKIISGLLKPSEGQVLLDGVDITDMPPKERNIAQVFQFPVVYETLTVHGNLAFPLRNRGVPSQVVKTRVREMAEVLGLTPMLHKNATKLGAAEKQLISLGRGIIREDLAGILLDEPLTVIDPQQKWHLRRKLKQLRERFKVTMIYVTHDQHEALTFADQITVMNMGEALQTGSAQDLHEAPQAPFVGYFIGSPGMNLFPVTIANQQLQAGSFQMALPVEMQNLTLGQNLKIGIRPEFIQVSNAAQSSAILCTVKAVYMTGHAKILDLAGADLEFKARVPETGLYRVGDIVWATFPPAQTMIYVNDRAIAWSAKEGM